MSKRGCCIYVGCEGVSLMPADYPRRELDDCVCHEREEDGVDIKHKRGFTGLGTFWFTTGGCYEDTADDDTESSYRHHEYHSVGCEAHEEIGDILRAGEVRVRSELKKTRAEAKGWTKETTCTILVNVGIRDQWGNEQEVQRQWRSDSNDRWMATHVREKKGVKLPSYVLYSIFLKTQILTWKYFVLLGLIVGIDEYGQCGGIVLKCSVLYRLRRGKFNARWLPTSWARWPRMPWARGGRRRY